MKETWNNVNRLLNRNRRNNIVKLRNQNGDILTGNEVANHILSHIISGLSVNIDWIFLRNIKSNLNTASFSQLIL